MYAEDVITALCRRIADEPDMEKALQLTSLLRAMIKHNIDEIKLLAEKHSFVFQLAAHSPRDSR
jgi:hypothetical protein